MSNRKIQILGLLIAMATLAGAFFVPEVRILLGLEPKSNRSEAPATKDGTPQRPLPQIVGESEPFHLDRIEPIIDGNLFVGRWLGQMIIGGVNLNLLSIAARSIDGAQVRMRISQDFKHGLYIGVDYEREPYFEIMYRNQAYAIEIVLGEARSPKYTLLELENVSMQLRPLDSMLNEEN